MTEQIEDDERRWWHAYGQAREDLGCFQLTVYGESTEPPEVAKKLEMASEGPYLASFDHDPTEDERFALFPPEYREP